jgi:hypothetical protein
VVHGLFDPARARTTGKTGTAWLSWHLDVEAPIRCQGAARRQGSQSLLLARLSLCVRAHQLSTCRRERQRAAAFRVAG